MTELMTSHEFPKMFHLLDAVQSRMDDGIFSKEDPLELQVIGSDRIKEHNRLADLMAPFPVENETINMLFNVMLENYVKFAKDMLPLEK